MDMSATQLLHLRLRDPMKEKGQKDSKSKGPTGHLAQDILFYICQGRCTYEISQYGCLNKTFTMTSVDISRWAGGISQGPAPR